MGASVECGNLLPLWYNAEGKKSRGGVIQGIVDLDRLDRDAYVRQRRRVLRPPR